MSLLRNTFNNTEVDGKSGEQDECPPFLWII